MALSLLKPCLEQVGLTARVFYANLWMANEVGVDHYSAPNRLPIQLLLGEWAFSPAAFPDFRPDEGAYYDQLALNWPGLRAVGQRLRESSKKFVEQATRRILADRPRIVGCSSVFQQHCASLAILRRVKELAPEVITVLGGSNCEGTMGEVTHRCFPWVDYVVSGEAEGYFPQLCRQLVDGLAPVLPDWILGPDRREKRTVGRGLVLDLDSGPVPCFDDFFAELPQTRERDSIKECLIAETSRGCWWGAKHHCTFCGLNGGGMGFRSKSADRVAREFSELVERYGINTIETVDNILDMRYLETLAPLLKGLEKPVRLFYETKANLRYDQLVTLYEAGVHWLQPGIESLDDRVLKLMDKGTTAMQNIQLLKWARELGMNISWNLLVDFPGEEDEWYRGPAEFVERIFHLQPPMGSATMRYDRYSPYQMRPSEYGVVLATGRFYRLVYPLPEEDLADLAYFFEDAEGSVRTPELRATPHKLALRKACIRWSERYYTHPTVLSLDDEGTYLQIMDTRTTLVPKRYRLEGLAREVYLACHQARSRRSLHELGAPEAIDQVLTELDRDGLILELNGRVLALAVSGSSVSYGLLSEYRLGQVENRAGELLKA